MLQRLREGLVLALLALIPFHAFLVTVGTKFVKGPGHAPLPALAVWKEVLLLLVIVIAIIEIIHAIARKKRDPEEVLTCDPTDLLIFALAVLAALVSVRTGVGPGTILGFKYDFAPLLMFLVLRRVPWTKKFDHKVVYVLLGTGVVIANYGLLTMILPMEFFRTLGYSDLHSIYLPDGPLPAFHQIGGVGLRRIQATFGGPNQLGMWLLLPWALAWSLYGRRRTEGREQWLTSLGIIFCLFAIMMTFSRAAWVAAVFIAVLAVYRHMKGLALHHVLIAVAGLAVAGVLLQLNAPYLLKHGDSTSDHIARPLAAMRTIAENPLGLGLGAAGPASNRFSDACIFVPGGDISWAKDRPNLCVFLADKQVQPTDRECNCPVLPENWYLQIGIELGVAGLLLFLALLVSVIMHLHHHAHFIEWHSLEAHALRDAALLAFLGISLAAVVLHSWEDSAVSYGMWLMLSIILPPRMDED